MLVKIFKWLKNTPRTYYVGTLYVYHIVLFNQIRSLGVVTLLGNIFFKLLLFVCIGTVL